ncbi:MAG: NTP transferase domain-containing protein [Thermoguttaceae bacterium]
MIDSSNFTSKMESVAVVMGAGKGTRMKSELPKVLFPVCDRPMIEYVLDTLEQAGVDRMLVVVGYRSDLVRETLAFRPHVAFVEQTEQLGTGHAVMMCRDQLIGHEGPVMVVAGDCPMIQVESVQKMFEPYRIAQMTGQQQPGCILGTAYKDNPFGLGRIVRDTQGDFLGIVEEKDATEEEKKITEVNMSYYVFHAPDLLEALLHLKTDNSQKEYYITDVPRVMKNLGKPVLALPILKPIESLGINTVEELAIVEEAMRQEAMR